MKKLFCLCALGLTTLALASCGGAKQEIIIKDKDGKEVSVEIKNTSDEQVVANAITYAAMADYSDIKVFGFNLNLKTSVKANNDDYLKLNLGGDLESNGGQSVFFELFGDMSASTKTTDGVNAFKLDGKANIYSSDNALTDQFIYLGYEGSLNDKKSSKKVKLSKLEIIALIGELVSKIEGQIPELPNIIPGGTSLMKKEDEAIDYLEELKNLKKNYPSSLVEVKNLSKESFELSVKISLREILAKALTDKNISVELPKTDSKMTFSYLVDITNGRPISVNLELNDKLIWDFINAILEDQEVDAFTLESPEFLFKLSLNTSFKTEGSVKSLASSEKKEYVKLDLKKPNDKVEVATN